MNKRGTGVVFCLIAAILFAARYITVSIFLSGTSSPSSYLFEEGLNYIGSALLVLSVISLIVGVIYLIWAEWEERRKK